MPKGAGILAGGLAALLGAAPGQAAPKKKPHPTPTATPMPQALLRAAGSCLAWVPGKHLILAEVGTSGRVFLVDSSTEIRAEVRVGSRVRILYVQGQGGPVARKILPGPVVASPASKSETD